MPPSKRQQGSDYVQIYKHINPESYCGREPGKGRRGDTSSATAYPKQGRGMPWRYSCSLISHSTAYQAASQAKHMASLPQNLGSLRRASQALFTLGCTRDRVISQVLWGLCSAAAGLPSLLPFHKTNLFATMASPLKSLNRKTSFGTNYLRSAVPQATLETSPLRFWG